MHRETRLDRRRFLMGVAATAGAAILSACGSSGSATTAPPTAAKATTAPAAAANATTAPATGGSPAAAPATVNNAKIKLNVAVKLNTPAEADLIQKAVDAYKAVRPNADVSVLSYEPTTYDQKLLTDISAGTLPDVFTCNDVYNKPFFQNGLIADLKP